VQTRNCFGPLLMLLCASMSMKNNTDKKSKIKKYFDSLTDREKESCLKILGIKDIGEFSKIDLKKIGEDYAITRQKIKEFEAKALRKLKHLEDEPPDDVA